MASFVCPIQFAGVTSAARVSTQGGEDFYAVMSMDSDAAHTAFDWGFSLLSEDSTNVANCGRLGSRNV